MKDPAFLFYSSDFLTGITDLTMEERGQFITLLCVQHQKHFLTEKTIRLSVGNVSVDVLNKFSRDENGNYFNERLRNESEKRQAFTESRRNNGMKGGRPLKNSRKKKNHKVNHMGIHMENDNENENEEENTTVSKKKKAKTEIDISEAGPELQEHVEMFLTHRKQLKHPIATQMQFDNWMKRLRKYGEGSTNKAKEIIEISIANGWRGIFDLPTSQNKNTSDNKVTAAEYLAARMQPIDGQNKIG